MGSHIPIMSSSVFGHLFGRAGHNPSIPVRSYPSHPGSVHFPEEAGEKHPSVTWIHVLAPVLSTVVFLFTLFFYFLARQDVAMLGWGE